MVNPSDLPNKKRRRRNPELLIVNPYSLDEDGKGKKKKKRAKMASKKRKKKSRSRSRNRSRSRSKRRRLARRNPAMGDLVKSVAGEGGKNIMYAGVAAVGGGAALAIGSKLLGERVGEGSVGQGILAVASGIGGGVVALKLSELLGPGRLGDFLRSAAIPGAIGAMTLGFWKIAQSPVEGFLEQRGLAGWGAWTKEFEGYSPYGQAYYDEFTDSVSPGGGNMNGFGQPVVAATDLVDPEDNPFLSGYEPLGDIYNGQRIGSFETESGLAGFVPETANPRDQQVADEMKYAAGVYGGYEGLSGSLWDTAAAADFE